MTPDSRERAEELFLSASELPAEARAEFLDARCGGDHALRTRVERMLELERSVPTGFLAGESNARSAYLEAGSSFAGYRVIGVLGQGGMGTVYAAEQAFPRRDVALKVVRSDRINPEALRRFEKEVQALGSLQHPGIAHVYDAGTARRTEAAEEEPYLAMELVRGSPIVEHASKRGLGARDRIELIARVADALHHAHQRGVIHRDLKPDNVLVVEDDTASFPVEDSGVRLGQPKVLDFGIARLLLGDAGPVETRAGELIGTLAHMSPEQVTGRSADLDERTDVYALGVLLYQLLSGRLPHDLSGLSVPEAVLLLSSEPPRPLETVAPEHRGDVAMIAARALDPDLGRRYPSAAALAEDLRRYLRGEPIRARSHSTLYVLRRSLRRHRAAVSFVAGLAAVVLVFGLALRGRSTELNAMAARRSEEVQQTLDSMRRVSDVARGLGQDWGASTHQRQLLETVLESYSTLLAERGRSREARALAISTRFEVSRIHDALGDDQAAREEALRVLDELRELATQGSDVASMIPVVRLHLARLEVQFGDLDQAREYAESALEAFASRGDSLEAAEAEGRLSEIERQRGHVAEAQRLARSALERLESLERTEEVWEEWITCVVELGIATYHLEGAEAAIEVYERLDEDLSESPLRDDLKHMIAAVDINLGRLYSEVGRPEDSERALVRAVEVGESLVVSFPEVEFHSLQLIASLNNLGSLYGMQERPAEAGACLERALELVEVLSEANPDHLEIRRQRDNLLTNVGMHRSVHGAPAEGSELLERALESWKGRVAAAPGDADSRGTLIITVHELAFARLRLGDGDGVLAALNDLPPVANLNDVGRALSGYSMLLRDTRDDPQLAAAEADERCARYAHAAGELLGRCIEAGFHEFEVLRTYPHFEHLRAEAEFAELLAQF